MRQCILVPTKTAKVEHKPRKTPVLIKGFTYVNRCLRSVKALNAFQRFQ